MRKALLQCFLDQPARVFGVQDLCEAFQKYYDLSAFQRELDLLYPQPRYVHNVRSHVAKLKEAGEITRWGRDQYQLSN